MLAQNISISGSIIHISSRIAIVKIPMNGSCAIPLEIAKPQGIELIAWSFVGFIGQMTSDPCCFLILSCQDEGRFYKLPAILVCMHIGDRCVSLSLKLIPPSRADTSVLAKAVLSALRPRILAHFDALIPVISDGLDTIMADSVASDLSLRRGDSADVWLAHRIDFVPDCLIVRSSAGYSYSSIPSVRFHALNRSVMTLTTDVPFNTHSVNGAILSGQGRYAAARVIGAV